MLQDKLQTDLKQAQIDRDERRISTLRLLLSEIHNAEIAQGEALSDEEIASVIQHEVKKRKEAAAGFRQGEREEKALLEEAEAEILSSYLPQQLSDRELTKIVEDTITELGATSISEIGKVIGAVIGKVKGQADGAKVSALVKFKLK